MVVIPARAFFTVILSSLEIREEFRLIMGIISSFIIHTEQWNRVAKWPVNVWHLHCWIPKTNGCMMYLPMKPAVHPYIKVPSDLISPRWRRSCSCCWFFMLHRNPLQLFLMCLLCLVVLYKESTALIHCPGNVRHSFLTGFRVFGAVSGSKISWPFSQAAELPEWQCQSVSRSRLKYLNNFWLDFTLHLVEIFMVPRGWILKTCVILWIFL